MNPVSFAARLAPVLATSTTAPGASVRQASTVTDSPSSQVILGQDTRVEDAETYSPQLTLRTPAVRYAWEQEDALDRLSMHMYSGVASTGIDARFKGLGASLIEQLAAGGGKRVSQSALVLNEHSSSAPAMLELQRANLRQYADNRVTLNLGTASGATVSIGLYSGEQGLAVEASVQDGTLDADELKALAALADGFQKEVDGLNQATPSLKLGDLLSFDQRQFTSLQMSARLDLASGEQQTLDLRIDGSQRSLDLQGPSGRVQLALDNQGGAILGNQAQREAALSNYLSQFEAARQRGEGDQQLNTLFKDAFSQLNRVDDSTTSRARQTVTAATLGRSMLSGLADFKASVSQTATFINPLHPEEADHFDYSVSQRTTRSAKGASLTLEQDQQASLKAAWHASLDPRVELQLTRDSETQNYRYHQVNDQSHSSTRATIVKGVLTEASSTQQASRSERVRTYQQGVLKTDDTTSDAERNARDQLNLINALLVRDAKSRREGDDPTFDRDMANNSHYWLLQGDPSRI